MVARPGCYLVFTSPRFRGEVGSLAIRARGSLGAFLDLLCAPTDAPHLDPLPAKAGRGGAALAWREG